MTVACPRCFEADHWRATGTYRENYRRKVRTAVLICESCGYVFTSGLPDAMDAAADVTGPDAPEPQRPTAHVPDFGRRLDFRRRQANDDDDA